MADEIVLYDNAAEAGFEKATWRRNSRSRAVAGDFYRPSPYPFGFSLRRNANSFEAGPIGYLDEIADAGFFGFAVGQAVKENAT